MKEVNKGTRKEKFPDSWLSELQKEILKSICFDKPELTLTKTLNWDIAQKLDKFEISDKTEKEILTPSHRSNMNRSLKRLRERDLITDFGTKKYHGATDKGIEWCKLNIDDFEQKQETRALEREKIKEVLK